MSLNTQEVLKYINLARQYPKYYVALLDEQINSFVDDTNIQLTPDTIYETIEGKSVWEDAKQFLVNQSPLRPFDPHDGIMLASADHARDIVKNNPTGHQGSDGSTFMDRIQRYCRKGKGSMIELLGATHLIPGKNSIELAVLNLIIDDGVGNRGHRKALFSKDYRYIGVDFIVSEDKIYSVISMSQSNLECLKAEPLSIATSTSHLNTMTQISSVKGASFKSPSKQNIIDVQKNSNQESRQFQQKSKSNSIAAITQTAVDPVWTLKNVTNEQRPSKTKVASKQNISQFCQQPSIVKQVEDAPHSRHSFNATDISNSHIGHQASMPMKQVRSIKKMNNGQIKESSLKNSQQSIKSDKDKKDQNSLSYGLASSQVDKFKLKSSFVSPFSKSITSSSGFSSTGNKKIVQKKQTMRTWNQQEYLVKQITTVVKYEDGSIQDFVEKHSVLKNQNNHKEAVL